MQTVSSGDAVIYYDTRGSGAPVLALAPGGLRASRMATWASAPWDPTEVLADRHLVVGMDQRNTGTSFAPIAAGDGWSSYAADQLAVMDHLGIERFAVIGMCIGGAFVMRLIAEAPERIAAAVALQPIGLAGNRHAFRDIFDQWRAQVGDEHPEADDADWEGLWVNMFGGDDLLFSVPDDFAATVRTPILVCRGADLYHPPEASHHLADHAPDAELIESWKEGSDLDAALGRVRVFLADHA